MKIKLMFVYLISAVYTNSLAFMKDNKIEFLYKILITRRPIRNKYK